MGEPKSNHRPETQLTKPSGLCEKPPKVMMCAFTSWEIGADSSSLVPVPQRLETYKALWKAPWLPTGEVEAVWGIKWEVSALLLAKNKPTRRRQRTHTSRYWARGGVAAPAPCVPWARASGAEVLLPHPASRRLWETLRRGKVVAGLPLEDRKTRAEKSLVSALQIMENISDNIPQTFRCLTKPDISIFLLWALSHLRRHELQTGFLSNPTWNFPNVLSPWMGFRPSGCRSITFLFWNSPLNQNSCHIR